MLGHLFQGHVTLRLRRQRLQAVKGHVGQVGQQAPKIAVDVNVGIDPGLA
jgi:hypothetical protein